jgi:hypothetical protein
MLLCNIFICPLYATSAPTPSCMDHALAERKQRKEHSKSMKRVSHLPVVTTEIDQEQNPYKQFLWEIYHSGGLETFIIKENFEHFIEGLRCVIKSNDFIFSRDGWFAVKRGEKQCEFDFGCNVSGNRLDDEDLREILATSVPDTLLTILRERLRFEADTMITAANFKAFIQALCDSMIFEARGLYYIRADDSDSTLITIVPKYRTDCIEMSLHQNEQLQATESMPSFPTCSSSDTKKPVSERPSDLRGFPSMPSLPSAKKPHFPRRLSKNCYRIKRSMQDSGF